MNSHDWAQLRNKTLEERENIYRKIQEIEDQHRQREIHKIKDEQERQRQQEIHDIKDEQERQQKLREIKDEQERQRQQEIQKNKEEHEQLKQARREQRLQDEQRRKERLEQEHEVTLRFHKNKSSPLDVQGPGGVDRAKDMARAGWATTKNTAQAVWEHPAGETMIIMTGVVATYAIISGIVKASRSVQMSEKTRVMPFNTTSSGIYNKDIDDKLKFVTALVSIQLRNLCNEGKGVSWDTLQAMMSQFPVLEPDQNKTDAQETFSGKFSETDVSTWFYDFVKKHDNDVFDAARIHSPEINEVIQFVGNHSVDFHVFSETVSDSSDLLDIGMIRFPAKKDPYVKLYRSQLKGTFSGNRFMMVFTSGEERTLTATVSARKYYPRVELLQCLQPETIQKVVATFEDMFAE